MTTADGGKRILFLTTGLTLGGAENQFFQVAVRLKDIGWNIITVSMTEPQAFAAELAAAGIGLRSLGMKRGVPDPRAIFRLAGICRKWQPVILHAHMVHANLLARVARPLCAVPLLISSAHNINEGGRMWEKAYRLTDRLGNLTTQVSRAAAEHYVQVKAVPEEKMICIPNGVDTGLFYPDRETGMALRRELALEDGFAWLAVGRLEAAKDYPNLLRAFSRVLDVHRDAVLLIVGQGSLEAEIRGLAATLGVSERVRLLGTRRDIPALMNAADGYVMSSAWEGMPNVLLEASACGLPMVYTDVGGNREVAKEGGIAVKPGDSAALAGAMLELMALPPEERRRLGEVGRLFVAASYSLESTVAAWDRLYKELLAGKGLG